MLETKLDYSNQKCLHQVAQCTPYTPLTCMHLIPHVVVVTPSEIALRPPSVVWEIKMGDSDE